MSKKEIIRRSYKMSRTDQVAINGELITVSKTVSLSSRPREITEDTELEIRRLLHIELDKL